MACAGIDLGNRSSVVAIARRGGIDICCNAVSNRSTPTLVSFSGSERLIGEAAASTHAQNLKNTLVSLPRLLALPQDSAFYEDEARRVTANLQYIPDVGPGVKVMYTGVTDEDGEESQSVFSVQAVLAMYLTDLMNTASREYKAPVKDLVISVPVWYNDAQKRAVLDAARIANINVLRVLSEHAATALSYGIFRTKELPEKDPIKVAFVDVGESSTTVSITSFTNTKCQVISVACDPSLGGRNLDDIIVDKFAEEFKAKFSIDVLSKPKPAMRLRKEAEKIKKVLSTVPEASLNIECLMNDVDVRGKMLRDELESLAAPLISRIRAVCEKAIAEANLAEGETLTAVEILGGSIRVPSIKAAVTETFAKVGAPVRTTLNADECIARGCALMSAMLSPAFRVRDYVVSDISTQKIDVHRVHTDGSPPETTSLVRKTNPIPCLKAMTFNAQGAVTLTLKYSDAASLPTGENAATISSYLLDAPIDPDAKIRTKIRVTSHGTLEIAGAQLIKQVEVEEEVPVKKVEEPTANGTDPAPANGTSHDTPMPDAATEAKEKLAVEGEAKAEADAKDVPMKEVPQMEKRIVKKAQSTDLVLTKLPGVGLGLTAAAIIAATEKEAKMRANDMYIKERSEAMNSLEAYVYDLRSRIDPYSGDLKDFCTDELRTDLKKRLDDAEEWIYSEEAEEASKSTFVDRKKEIIDKATSLTYRKKENDERPVRVNVLEAAIQSYKQVALPGVEKYAHISDEDKQKVIKCTESIQMWLKDMQAKQAPIKKSEDPVLTCADLDSKWRDLQAICRPIESTPKPKPPEKPTEKSAEKPSGKSDEKADAATEDQKMEDANTTNAETAEQNGTANDTSNGAANGMDVEDKAEGIKA